MKVTAKKKPENNPGLDTIRTSVFQKSIWSRLDAER